MRPTILFNTGWMERYDGRADISGGGSYIKEHGIGWEIYNFKNFGGKAYGYVQPSGENLAIERIGARKGADTIDGVLVIFTATHPQYGGLHIVGWYHDALLHRAYQEESIRGRHIDNKIVGYYAEADYKNVKLLTPDERIGFIDLPSRLPSGSGWKGRSNVWYAEHGDGEQHKLRIVNRIDEYESQTQQGNRAKRTPPLTDIKKKVEVAAMNCVACYFKENNYTVEDVSKKNLGWDLEASKGKHILRIEVKGLSGAEISVDLTKNEYEKMRQNKDNAYRLAIITHALADPELYVFEFSIEQNKWIDPAVSGMKLNIEEFLSARCTAII